MKLLNFDRRTNTAEIIERAQMAKGDEMENQNTLVNQKEIVRIVAEQMNKTQSEVHETLNSVLDFLVKTLKEGYEVSIPRFGRLKTRQSTRTVYRDPKTGKTIKIAAKRMIRFKAATALKRIVNSCAT